MISRIKKGLSLLKNSIVVKKINHFVTTSVFLKKPLCFLNTYKLPLLSGVLFGCSFIPFPFFLFFFSLVPLWLFIYQQSSFKRVLIACILCQFLSTLIGFNWMIYTFHNFGEMNWFVSFILLCLFSLVMNFYVTFSGCLWFLLVKKSPYPLSVSVKLILFPLIFSLLHSLTPTMFPWNMGYTWLWGGLFGAQTAEIWGFRFLNTLFYVFNLLFLILCKHRFDSIGKRALVGAVALFAFLNLFGFYLKKRLPPTNHFLNVIVVQQNIGSIAHLDSKSFSQSKRRALYTLRTLTYRAFSKYAKSKKSREEIDFIIWPEGAYSYTINKRARREGILSRMTKRMQVPLITGAMSRQGSSYGNSLVAFDRKGNILKPIYDKVKLLIFGEYFPGMDSFPFLRKLFPYFGSNFSPGKNIQVQELEGVFFGWQICYEGLFDQISREQAQKKAQVLVNITNDSWYGSWQEPYQHLMISFARAIETRRSLIRSTNTGYSGVIHFDGTISPLSPLNKAWFQLYKVPYYKKAPKTLFMSWGYYINEMFLLALFSFVLLWNFLYTKRKQDKDS